MEWRTDGSLQGPSFCHSDDRNNGMTEWLNDGMTEFAGTYLSLRTNAWITEFADTYLSLRTNAWMTSIQQMQA